MSSKQWKELYFREIAKLLYGKSLSAKKRIGGKYNVYGSGGIIGTHNDSLVEGPGIIIGRKGTVGSVYFEKNPYFPIDTTYYIKDSFNYNIKYLFYMLCNANLNIMNTHSAVPGLNRDNLYQKKFKVPKLEEQKQIATILSSLDEKIELNNQINKNLEEMAQAIFKHWFIDFEFPNENGEPYKSSGGEMVNSELGSIPKEWRVITFKEIIRISSGKRPKEKENEKNKKFNVPLIGASSIMGYVSEILYMKPILVIGRVGTHGIVQRINKKSWPSDNTLVIQSEYYEYIYQILKNIDYQSINRGSTQPLITQTDIKKCKIVFPKYKLLRDFEKRVGSLFQLINKNKEGNRILSRIRDVLLPKLMSGEIRVPINNKEGDE